MSQCLRGKINLQPVESTQENALQLYSVKYSNSSGLREVTASGQSACATKQHPVPAGYEEMKSTILTDSIYHPMPQKFEE